MTDLDQYINRILEFANEEWISSVLLVLRNAEIRQRAYDFVARSHMTETWLGEYPRYFIHLKKSTDVCCATMDELPTMDVAKSFGAVFFIEME